VQKTELGVKTDYFYQGDSVLYIGHMAGQIGAASFNLLGPEGNVISIARSRNSLVADYYSYNKDVRGSTTNLIDASGSAVASYEYTDFGETTATVGEDFNNEICYTGGVYDKSTQLYYLNARYYNPGDARFITQDTYRGEKKEPDTWNLYAYCHNNPINFTDPTGHWAWSTHSKMTGEVFNSIYKKYPKLKTLDKKKKKAKLMTGSYQPDIYYTGVYKYHGGTGYNGVKNTFIKLARTQYGEKKYDKAAEYLGMGLHTVQDYWAHNIKNEKGNWTHYSKTYTMSEVLNKKKRKKAHSKFDNVNLYSKGGKWKKTTYKNNSRIKNAKESTKAVLKSF
jgi:RHS repeat-associated protein